MDTAGQPEVPPASQPPVKPAGPQPAPTALSVGGLPPTTYYQGKLPFAWAGVIASFQLFATAILFSTAYPAVVYF
jgi:hypothetical protein